MHHMVFASLFVSTIATSGFSWSHFSLGKSKDEQVALYPGGLSGERSAGQVGLYFGGSPKGNGGRQGKVNYETMSSGKGSNEQGGMYSGGSFGNIDEVQEGYFNGGGGGDVSGCGAGQVQQVDGSCVIPDVTKSVFIFDSPEILPVPVQLPLLPKPKVNYNVVFVHTPEQPEEPEPIVIPPPKDKTLVYVLTKNEKQKQEVIEVPGGPNEPPKVLYVNYNKGDNPSLPGGFQLQEILKESESPSGGSNNNDALSYSSNGGYNEY